VEGSIPYSIPPAAFFGPRRGLRSQSEHVLENPPYDFDAVFRTVVRGEAQMLHVLSSPAFNPQRAHIAELAIGHRLPTMFIFRTYVEAGGLMSYGVDTGPMWRCAASYVAKILRGRSRPICRSSKPRISSLPSI
jgi:hypothetical protein